MTVANGIIARWKNPSAAAWAVLGLLFDPIAFVALVFLPRLDDFSPLSGRRRLSGGDATDVRR